MTDCAALLQVIASYDSKDSTSVRLEDYDFIERSDRMTARGMRIGIPREYFGEGLNPEVKEADAVRSRTALRANGSSGGRVCTWDMLEYAIPAYYVIASAEASSNLERFDGVKYGYRSGGCTRGFIDMYK